MAVIRLTEGDLHRIVRKVLSESMLLSEGYSGKYFESQIVQIVNQFMEYKLAVDEQGERNVPQYYPITISLKPFFNENDRDVDYHYLEDNNFIVRIAYRRNGNGHLVPGSYHPLSIYKKSNYNIDLRPESKSTWQDVYITLLHEVTHLVDDQIKNCKGHNAPTYPHAQMKYDIGLPDCICRILYSIWGYSEFNAWQVTYRHIIGDKDITEWAISVLKMANEINDENVWERVKTYVAMYNPHLNLTNKSPMAFKNYFIKTSFKLIKKLVKKYY